ncbi:hypothetical protein [Aeromicrobium sp. UC242_57]|uniref:hypothetical protein n=1 Tax=Aeromicrobium sp. UC242_57 TaxID=3374624 RepID=UPI0037C0C694
MPPVPVVPDGLRHRPFHVHEARALGVTERQLRGKSWVSPFPRVWVHVDHVMSDADWMDAARLTMPGRAQLSHISRLQQLGLDVGDKRPFHFVVSGDLHIEAEDIFLHRTTVLPPLDETGVTPAVAFVQFCEQARMIDAIKVGDWLLRRRHMTSVEVGELIQRDRWRPGAREAVKVMPHLDARSRSLKESESRAVLVFSGLPSPDVNRDVFNGQGDLLGCGDLVYLRWKVLVEYEGRQHLTHLTQWNTDIDRYSGLRDGGWRYVQVTNEKLAQPRKARL